METVSFPSSARSLANVIGAELVGDPDLQIQGLSALNLAPEKSLTFFSDKRQLAGLEALRNSAVLTKSEWVRSDLPLTFLVVNDPKRVFSLIAKQFRPNSPVTGRHPSAFIDEKAHLGSDVKIGPFVTVEAGAVVGDGTSLGAYTYVGKDVVIGENAVIHPRVTLLSRICLGSRVQIFPGTVVGSDGFGFVAEGEGLSEVPQIGTVVIEDDVRIGANCTIDRATLGETRIGSGTKIDNLVHIAHNVKIGKNCILCGQTGIAGSSRLHDRVTVGGQAGITDNVEVGAGATIGARAGVSKCLEAGGTYFLSPAVPSRLAVQITKATKRLPELSKKVKELEKRILG